MEAKECKECGSEKPLTAFNKNSKMRDGRLNTCRPCHTAARRASYCSETNRKYALKKNYGITPEEYGRMLDQQGGECRICGLPESAGRYGRLCVDHCHKTGDVRALLCSECNAGLGKFQDDPRLMLAAIDFLRDHGS